MHRQPANGIWCRLPQSLASGRCCGVPHADYPASACDTSPSSTPRRAGLAAIAALFLLVGAVLPAHAQARGLSSSAQVTDTSYFDKYHPAPRDTLPLAAYTGWEQFQINCSRCHGQDAQGTSFAPSLAQALGRGGAVPTEAAFLEIACDGVAGTGMPSWCKLGLGMDKLREIYLYVKGRADGTIHPGRPMSLEDSTPAT
jgi:mono/diheme cytochrome c family protein